jgi:hypothetical protein
MRCTFLAIGIAMACASVVLATPASQEPNDAVAASRPDKVVYLSGAGALDALRTTHPTHYARAQRIIAAANELCRPGPLDMYFARFEARDISCDGMRFRTSNPPKRQISFKLDATRYIALVAVTDQPPRLVPAR